MTDTYFATAERTKEKDLAAEIEVMSRNPVVSGLLHSISGLLAVLDEHRQIVALNDSFLKMLGIEEKAEALGLRPGEALQCIHACEEPAGCGTTKFCSTCGAAIAIVAGLGEDKPVERTCALTVNRGGNESDMALLVKSQPIKVNEQKFLLLFLQDITRQEQRAALERTFFHDVNNMLFTLVCTTELLILKNPSELSTQIHQASLRLYNEIAIQRCLSESEVCSYQPLRRDIRPEEAIAEIKSFFANHPAAYKRQIQCQGNYPDLSVNTDPSLLSRVLCNMLMNALEATEENGIVKIWVEHDADLLTFCVWNAQAIPPEIALRIFQRNFTTKAQSGRGTGTFAMKFLGEKILGGSVNFETSPEKGTVFKFSLPL